MVFTLLVFALISWTTLSSWFGAPRTPAPAASPVATTAMGIESTTPVTVAQVAGGEAPGSPVAPEQAGADMLAIWVSSVSSITALLGLLATVYFGLRRERRESAQAAADLQKTQLEVELLKSELEQAKASQRHT